MERKGTRSQQAERLAYCQMIGNAIVTLDDRLRETMLKCEDQRDAAVAILADVCTYLDQAGASPEATSLLRRLAVQLDDLETGNVGDLVAPARVLNRPSNPIRDQMVALRASLAMECEIHFGKKKTPAAQFVAALLHEHGIRTGRDGKPLTARTVANWRDRLNEGPKRQTDWSYAHGQYRHALARLDSYLAHPGAARRLVAELPALLAAVGNRTKPPS